MSNCVKSGHSFVTPIQGIKIPPYHDSRVASIGHPAGVQFSCISRVSPVKPSACGRGRTLPPRMTLFIVFLLYHIYSAL